MHPLEQVAKRLKGLIIKRPGIAFGLWGEAGIGKTFTTTHLLRESTCKNISLHATASLSNLARALPQPKTLPMWATRILEKLEGNEHLSTEQTTSAFGAVLSGIAPFIIHLEDIHEASSERLEWIQALAKVITRLKSVALIVTSRAQPPEPFEAIRLEKLDFEAIKLLLEQEARSALPLEAVEWIHTKAAGNPLFTLEFFKLLARQGFVWNDGHKWRWRVPGQAMIPTTVEALVERAIAEACRSELDRQTLEAKSYLESLLPNLKLTFETWAKVMDVNVDTLKSTRIHLQSRGVLNETGFVHPLFLEMSFKSLSIQVRQILARRALEVFLLEEVGVLIEDAQLGADRSRKLLLKIAQNSNASGHWLALAMNYASGEERFQLALEAAQKLAHSDIQKAEHLYRLVLQENMNDDLMLEFISFLSPRHYTEAKNLFDRLPESVRNAKQGLVVCIALMSLANDQIGIITLWQKLGAGSNLEPDLLVHVIFALKALTRFDEAIELASQILQRDDLTPWQRARVLNRQSTAYSESNRYTQALDLIEQILELLKVHNLPGQEVILYDKALNHKQLGDLGKAKQNIEQGLAIAIKVGRTDQIMLLRSFLGSMHLEFGEYEIAEEMLLESYEYLVRKPPNLYLADTLHNLIELYVGWTDHSSNGLLAQKYTRLALECGAKLNLPVYLAATQAYASFAELTYGSAERALELALNALAWQVQGDKFLGFWFPTWLQAKASAKLGASKQAQELLEQVVNALKQMGRTFEVNLVSLDLFRLQNNIVAAKEYLQWFRDRGYLNAVNASLRLFPEFDDTVQQKKVRVAVQFQVLGTLQISQDEITSSIKGQKRKELLILLLETRVTGKSELTRLELFDAIYPDEDEDRAASSLKELIRSTRANLGTEAIQTTQNGYALGQVTSDVEEFLKTGDSSLWRGSYVQGLEITSSEAVRELLELALQNCIQNLLETDAKEAARVSRFLLELNLYDLEILRLCIQAFKASDNYKTLGRIYMEARERLNNVGESLPERWQDFLEISIPA
jgi:hypothetical protein